MIWLLTLLRTSRGAQLVAIVIVAALLAFTVERCARHAIDKGQESATETGRQQQRADDLQETISQAERANNAAETIRRDPDARRAECLRDSRAPENC